MVISGEFRKIGTLAGVPIAVTPGAAKVVGQCVKLTHVVGLRGEKSNVIGNAGRDKIIVLGTLARGVVAVDKYAFNVGMTASTGIAGKIEPLG